MCWRSTWEAEHHRYYLKTTTSNGLTLYEEVQSLRGVNAFNEKNKPLIQKAMAQERKLLDEKSQCEKCASGMPHSSLKELGRTNCPSCWLETKESKSCIK